jgi:MFS superfamily sulfate permease-like transporter
VVGALIVALLIVAAPMLFQYLPYAALAGVVIAAAIGLFEFGDLGRIYRIQRWEFWLSILCTSAWRHFGAIPASAWRSSSRSSNFCGTAGGPLCGAGRSEGVEGYHDIARYPEARRIPGLVLFRWDAPLFFANAEQFNDRILRVIAESPTRVQRIVVSAAPITSVDVTAADASRTWRRSCPTGIDLQFAELKDPVKDKIRRFGLLESSANCFHPTIGAQRSELFARGPHAGAD